MAKYILAGSSDRPLGSRQGATFQRAGKVFVIRHRVVPKQKRSDAQSQVKNRFDSVQKIWRTLSSGQQTSFADETINYPRLDSLGNPYFLQPSALAGSSNLNLVNSGNPPISTMPAPDVFPGYSIGQLGVETISQSVNAALLTDPVPAGFSLVVSFTAGQSSGNPNENGTFHTVAIYAQNTNTIGVNWWNSWRAIFGDGSQFNNQFFTARYQLISLTTGQADTPQYAVGEVLPV
jgi:hypothetical protein